MQLPPREFWLSEAKSFLYLNLVIYSLFLIELQKRAPIFLLISAFTADQRDLEKNNNKGIFKLPSAILI